MLLFSDWQQKLDSKGLALNFAFFRGVRGCYLPLSLIFGPGDALRREIGFHIEIM